MTSGVSMGWKVVLPPASGILEARGIAWAEEPSVEVSCAVCISQAGGIAHGQVAHFEHLLDGRDAGDGFLGELADAVGERANQLAVDVDGAAAHAIDDAGVFGLGAVELGENEVLAGAARAAQDAEDLDLHGLGSGP